MPPQHLKIALEGSEAGPSLSQLSLQAFNSISVLQDLQPARERLVGLCKASHDASDIDTRELG